MGPPEIGVVVVGPEGRDLKLVTGTPDGDRPELVLVDGVLEQRSGLLGQRRAGQVPVAARPSEKGVSQGPADDIRRMSRAPERSKEVVDRVRDRAAQVVGMAQFRPRKRYVRQASLRSSAR
jgi:hypothetical protein